MFRILHISDLHIRPGTKWSTKPILNAARELIIEKASEENIDLVAFTGDIAFSGKPEEYELAQSWLDSLCLSSSGLNLQKSQILIVPGNHDVDRSLINPAASAIEEMLRGAKTQADVSRFYEDDGTLQTLLRRHSAFYEFTTSLLGSARHAKNAYSATFATKAGARIRVDCLNTSWLCRGGDDHRRLLVGQSQLTELSDFHTVSESNRKPDVRVVLMHHPLADLMEFDESNTANHLKQHADIVLRGHQHKAYSGKLSTNTGGFLELGAGSLHETHECRNSFNIIDISDDMSLLRVNTFIWSDGRWILDRNLYQTPDGIGEHKLPSTPHHAPPASQHTQNPLSAIISDQNVSIQDTRDAITPVRSVVLQHVPRFERTPTLQDTVIRQKQLEDAVVQIKSGRFLVLQTEPGSKHEGFLACIVAELKRVDGIEEMDVFNFDCTGITSAKELQDNIELIVGQRFMVFAKAIRETERTLVVFSNLDYRDSALPSTVLSADSTIDALRDFCPEACFIRTTCLPCGAGVLPIHVTCLDVADARSYLNSAPNPVRLSSSFDYLRVHRATGGLPIHLDVIAEALVVADLEEALAQANRDDPQPLSTLPESIARRIDELKEAATDDMRRKRSLLWALAILDQGESLQTIKRLDDKFPIWPAHAAALQAIGCIDSVSISPQFPVAQHMRATTDGDKILRVPRLVRDYVLSTMPKGRRESIIRDIACLYFSDGWRSGTVRLRQRLSVGTEISTHQSGNEIAVIRNILQNPRPFFGKNSATALALSTSYIHQLKNKGCFGEAYEAARDVLAITRAMPDVYPMAEAYFVVLLAASCARMVGDYEHCVSYVDSALPYVRESGVKTILVDALVTHFLALHTLGRNDDAKRSAEEVVSISPRDSSDYLQAKAKLAEIELPRPDAIRYLKQIAKKARNLGHYTVADNAILEVASDCDNSEEKLEMLNEVRSRRERSYNFVRATIRRVEMLMRLGRVDELTQTDRDDLWFSYSLCYTQRIAPLFDLCHRVLWEYLVAVGRSPHVCELFEHSSFVWRLRGEGAQELKYSIELQAAVSVQAKSGVFSRVLGYARRRVGALTASVGG